MASGWRPSRKQCRLAEELGLNTTGLNRWELSSAISRRMNRNRSASPVFSAEPRRREPTPQQIRFANDLGINFDETTSFQELSQLIEQATLEHQAPVTTKFIRPKTEREPAEDFDASKLRGCIVQSGSMRLAVSVATDNPPQLAGYELEMGRFCRVRALNRVRQPTYEILYRPETGFIHELLLWGLWTPASNLSRTDFCRWRETEMDNVRRYLLDADRRFTEFGEFWNCEAANKILSNN